MMTLPGFPPGGRAVAALLGCVLLSVSAVSAAESPGTVQAAAAVPLTLSAGGAKALPEEGPIRGPMLGYVFDPLVSGLRPLPGIPGASYVGSPLPLDFTPEFVEVSPSHQYAVGVEAGTREVVWIDLRSAIPTSHRLAEVGTGADRIFFSPLGKAVALYYRQAKRVEILTGLPGEAELQGRVELANVPGLLTALAVSDDGETLAAAATQGDGGSLYVAGPGEDVQLSGPLGRASALGFLHDSQDLLIADMTRNELLRVRNAKTAAEWTVLASRRDGVDQPIAVAPSRDNQTAYAVNRADGAILRMPLGGGSVESLDCSCAPTGLDALAPGSVFRLTSASSAPMYMLDARVRGNGPSSQPRVLFIPGGDREPGARDDLQPKARGRVRR